MRIVYPFIKQLFFRNLSRLCLLILAVSAFSVYHAHGQTTITIGAGATSGTASNGATGDSGPMYRSTATSSFVYSRHHYLYTQAELAAAGINPGELITKLAWNKDLAAASNAPFTFQIWIKNSTRTDVGAGGQNWTDLINGSTEVYNNTAENLASAPQWHEFNFTSPFTYTGGALEISVNFDMSSGTSPWTTAGISWKRDPLTNRTLSYVGSSAPGATLPNLRTVRPQIQITTMPSGPCTSPPTAGAATASVTTVCSGSAVTIGLTGNSIGTGQTYQLQSAATSGGVYSDVGSSGSTTSFVVNPTSTTWYRVAVTCSGQTRNSNPVEVVVNPGMAAGTYTINSGAPASATNFTSFGSAVNAMSCGITGPIVFNVTTGTYNEQVVIPEIAGTSAVNTILFNGNGATLAFSPSISAERSVLRIDGTDYVTIDSLIINATGGTYGWGIHLTNQADHNTIIRSTVITDMGATTTNFAGIVMSGSLTSATTSGNSANNTVIRRNSISGGYYGIITMGQATTLSTGNTIDSNTINNIHFYNVYAANQENLLVHANDIKRTERTAVNTFYGVYLTTAVKSATVSSNRIHNSHDVATSLTGAVYGIYVNGPAPAGFETQVYNNIIYNINNSGGLIYALYLNDEGIRAYHNSVSLDDQAATAGSTRGIMVGNYTNINVRNNIIVVTRGGTGAKYGIYSSSSSLTENYDVIYVNAPSANFGFWGADQATLTDWRNTSGQGANTMDVDPLYVSPSTGNLFPGNTFIDDKGIFVGVTHDILNISRSTSTPDPGAYEIPPPVGLDVGVKGLKFPGIKNCYSNMEVVTVTLRNFSATTHDFTLNPVTIEASVSGAATVTFPPVVKNTGTLAGGDTLDIEIVTNLDMTTIGGYFFNASSTLTGDVRSSNNAMPSTTINVSPLVPGTAASDRSSYCAVGGTPTITLTGNAGGDIQWQESTSSTGPWSDVGTNSSTYTPSTAITSTMYYRAELRCGSSSSASNTVTVEFNNPQVLTTTDGTRCGTGTVTLGATTSSGADLKWYTTPTGGTAIATGPSFTTPVISSTTTYYVASSQGGGTANVGPLSTAIGTIGSSTIVIGTQRTFFDVLAPTLTLVAVDIFPTATIGSAYSIVIQNSAGTEIFNSGSRTTTVTGGNKETVVLNAIIPQGTDYRIGLGVNPGMNRNTTGAVHPYTVPGYVSITGNSFDPDYWYFLYNWEVATGCEGSRTAVTATVTPAPAFTVTEDQGICNNSVLELRVTSTVADFDTYTWTPQAGLYTDPAATAPYTGGNAATVYFKSNTAGTVKYYASAGNSVTNCANLDSVSLTVLPAAMTISATPQELCFSGTASLSLDPATDYTGSTIQWFSSPDGTTFSPIAGAENVTYTTPTITSTTHYRAVIRSGSGAICLTADKTITVNSPAVVSVSPASRCGTGTVDLAATASPGANLQWYSSATGGSALAAGTNFTTPLISSTTTYYVGADQGGSTNNVGLTDNTGAISGGGTTNYGLVFDAFVPFTLNSVMVYPVHATAGTPGTVTIDVIDGSGNVVHTATVNVTGYPVSSPVGERVNLNFNIQPGTNYKLRPGARTGITGLLFGPTAAAPAGGNYGYPFMVPGVVSINTSTLTAAPTNTARNDLYYYFYDWSISTGCESPSRTAVTATVLEGTVITAQPSSVVICGSGSASFTVAATGTAPLTYQWYKDGVAISGATTDTYSITNPTSADEGSYTVTVTGCNDVTSNTATLTMGTATSITTQPVAQTVCEGTAASFTVASNGTGLGYQWRKNGVNMTGATAATLTFASVASTDAGSYDVMVTGACGTETSSAVVLTVDAATLITVQPANQTVCENAAAGFSVTATGAGTLSYQWRKNGSDISGATSASYSIASATAADAGSYEVIVTGSCGSVTSSAVTLTVDAVTAITTQPVAQAACEGGSVSFNVTATGSGTLTYQWRKNGTDISGATSGSLVIASVVAADAASYDVVVTGSCGSVTSATAALTLNAATSITTQPAAQIVCSGSTATFTVVADGTGLTYQWRKAGTDISGATAATLAITNAGTADVASYDVVVTGTCGTVTSVAASLTITAVTDITTQPVSQTVCNNGSVVFTVGAAGSALTYQWRKGGVNIGGATSANFALNPVMATDAATYDVIVTGNCGKDTSDAVTLTVTPTTTITTQPSAQSICAGANAAFSVTAAGAGLTYQWRKGGTDITGATSSTLTISNVAAADAGNYDVVVTGTCGTVTSNAVALTVNTCTSVPAVDTDIASVKLMPNVFESRTLLRVNALRSSKINWTITDSRGRVVMTFSRSVMAGQNDIQLLLGHLANGTYFLRGETGKGVTEMLRFIRL